MRLLGATFLTVLLAASALAQAPSTVAPSENTTENHSRPIVPEEVTTPVIPHNGANVPGFVFLPVVTCGFLHLLAKLM
ncbi:hypothetical protein AAHC03_019417 [Spirometra sp. Aus1]